MGADEFFPFAQCGPSTVPALGGKILFGTPKKSCRRSETELRAFSSRSRRNLNARRLHRWFSTARRCNSTPPVPCMRVVAAVRAGFNEVSFDPARPAVRRWASRAWAAPQLRRRLPRVYGGRGAAVNRRRRRPNPAPSAPTAASGNSRSGRLRSSFTRFVRSKVLARIS